MGRVAIAPENKTGEGAAGFPSIKLTEKGQKTRFTILEKPWREYVHYIKCPQFLDNGKPKKVKRTRAKSGDEYEDYDLELVGTELCLGDEGILQGEGNGLDEKNCPACEASVRSGGDIPGPTQRFAVNVAEYGITPSAEIKKPFSANIKVWKFTGRIYDEIEGIQSEIGDLRKHDLVLECEDPHWNRNKLSFRIKPGFAAAPEGYMKELITTPGNKATDAQLKDACGREVSRARMQDDVDYAMRQWRRLNTEAGEVPEEFKSTAADLGEGLDDILGTSDPDVGATLEGNAPAGHDHAAADEDPFAEFAPETTSNPSHEALLEQEAAQPAQAAPAGAASQETAPSVPESSSEGGEDFDFDGLLDGI